MRILALDVGEKTIGVALSDELGSMAFPGETILRQEGKKRDMAALRRIVAERGVSEIVVGMPLMLDGTRGIQAEKVEAFIAILHNNVRIPIHIQDERLSTREAERVLIAADRRRDDRKRTIDSMAACLILQTYLDRKLEAGTGECAERAGEAIARSTSIAERGPALGEEGKREEMGRQGENTRTPEHLNTEHLNTEREGEE